MAKPLIIGHRGASVSAPENTIAAFKLALKLGADGVEFDVQLSGDGVPVVIHDASLRRTAFRSEQVSDLPVSELTRIGVGTWFTQKKSTNEDQFCDERIPTLNQVLELFSPTNAFLYLEMKPDPGRRAELAKACCDLVNRSPARNRVILESFDLAAIQEVKKIDLTLKTAALFEFKLSNAGSLLASKRLASQARSVDADEIALHHRLATKRTVDSALMNGLEVVVWTVDDPTWVVRSNEFGVKALITNDPARMLSERDRFRSD